MLLNELIEKIDIPLEEKKEAIKNINECIANNHFRWIGDVGFFTWEEEGNRIYINNNISFWTINIDCEVY